MHDGYTSSCNIFDMGTRIIKYKYWSRVLRLVDVVVDLRTFCPFIIGDTTS